MDERDLSGEPRSWGRVEQLDAHLLERCQRLDDVLRVEAEVVEPFAVPGQKAPDARRRVQRLEELDLGLAGAEQRGPHVLIRDRRLGDERQPQRVTVEAIRLRQPVHDNADVVNPSHHAHPLSERTARSSGWRRRGYEADDGPGAWTAAAAVRRTRAPAPQPRPAARRGAR